MNLPVSAEEARQQPNMYPQAMPWNSCRDAEQNSAKLQQRLFPETCPQYKFRETCLVDKFQGTVFE